MQNRPITHKNEIFRFLECKLTIEKTAQICDVNQNTVKKWDAGRPIPAYYEKIMKTYAGINLDNLGWHGWRFEHGKLVSPMGYRFTPDMLEYLAIMHTPDNSKSSELQRLLMKRRNRRS